MKVLLINSHQRSGSTLMGNLLGFHPALRYLGEVRNTCPPHQPSALETEAFQGSDFWSEVAANLPPLGPDMATRTGNGLSEEDCFENIRKIYRACAAAGPEPWLVDSSKRSREGHAHLAALGKDFRVLQLTRDGRAVLNSTLKRRNVGHTIKETCTFLFRWIRFNIGAQRLRRAVPEDQLIRVRYEDLCARPLETLNRIVAFLGEEPFPEDAFDQARHGVYVGGSSTFGGVGEGLSKLREDKSWEAELPGQARVLFNILGRPMNAYLGY